MKSFSAMSKAEREAFVVFRKYAHAHFMTMDGLRAMAEDMQLDFDVLRALVDDDGDCQVSFDEFVQFWSNDSRFACFHGEKLDKLRGWLDYFQQLDHNGDGVLSVQEIEQFCKAQNWALDVNQLLAALDKDNSGTIGFEEFLTWYQVEL